MYVCRIENGEQRLETTEYEDYGLGQGGGKGGSGGRKT